MLAILMALALAALQDQYDNEEQVLAPGQVWSVMATDSSCLAHGGGELGGVVSLSRAFDEPARQELDLTGSIARRHAGHSGIPIGVRLLSREGRETGRLYFRMAARPDGRDLSTLDAPADLVGRMRGAARAEFTDGQTILAVSLADLPAALDEFDRCMAAHSATGE